MNEKHRKIICCDGVSIGQVHKVGDSDAMIAIVLSESDEYVAGVVLTTEDTIIMLTRLVEAVEKAKARSKTATTTIQ